MNKLLNNVLVGVVVLFHALGAYAQTDTTEYHLTITQETVNITGKDRRAMKINGGIPGPTLRFKEGDVARIYVTNQMDCETSVHWHGLLLPNYYDGVPYLTTPPIEPGETQEYVFPLIQSGTYWYHSHTMLQEQSGLYGSIVIEPKENKLEYDSDLVLLLSDWTDENPMYVLKNLKRRNEWYSIKRKTVVPVAKAIAEGGLGALLKFWMQRMPGADIADVYYSAFLTNGAQQKEYPQFKPGEKVRVRMINGSASSYYWLTFGGLAPMLVSADGIDVVPVKHEKTLFAIAETYDFIVTIPESGKLEIRATSMDGAGSTSAFLGSGDVVSATEVTKPDYVKIMKAMAKMKMKMGAPAMVYRPSKKYAKKRMDKFGMKMKSEKNSMEMGGMGGMNMDMHSGHGKAKDAMPSMDMKMDIDPALADAGMGPDQGYDFLKALEPTAYKSDTAAREIELVLNGNMWRYVWSMNGKILAEDAQIKIDQNEVVRITLKNLTMMNHPMHLHGHFFRVINKNGEYSPLKHTVSVAPMQTITIEFEANEYGDWFFHCHVLYHMMGGMARVFSYDTPRDPRMKRFPLSTLIKETDRYYFWGTGYAASQMASVEMVLSNVRNQFNVGAEYGWYNPIYGARQNVEADISYERYLSDYFRVYVGGNIENGTRGKLEKFNPVGQVGIRYLLPFFINADLSIDHQVRPQLRLSAEYLIFRRVSIFGRYEVRPDFGVVNTLDLGKTVEIEHTWNAGIDVILSRNFSLTANYDNRFGPGGGLTYRF